MKSKFRNLFRSFKSKILLSFFAFIRIFLLWICIYFVVNYKQTNLNIFTNHLAQLQNHYSEGNRNLQNFILTGYHQPSFYTTNTQKDIDLFFAEQDSVLTNLGQIKDEAVSNHIDIKDEVQAITTLQIELLDTVKLLKQLYLLKGFKDFGSEGTLRNYAHFLEDSCPILKEDILMLRRREKDFMLRDEQRYIDDVNEITDRQIKKFKRSPVTLNALMNYKKYFNEFAGYTQRLSLNTNDGMYGHLQAIINELDNRYIRTNAKVIKEVSSLNNVFKNILITTFILLLLAAIYLTIVLSKRLTKDIKKLNNNVAGYVRSGFREETEPELLISNITEIQGLNNDFLSLRQTLKQTLANLENTVKEEKRVSAEHEATIARLKMQIAELEQQKGGD